MAQWVEPFLSKPGFSSRHPFEAEGSGICPSSPCSLREKGGRHRSRPRGWQPAAWHVQWRTGALVSDKMEKGPTLSCPQITTHRLWHMRAWTHRHEHALAWKRAWKKFLNVPMLCLLNNSRVFTKDFFDYLIVCMFLHLPHGECGGLSRVGSLLEPCGSCGSNSAHQSLCQHLSPPNHLTSCSTEYLKRCLLRQISRSGLMPPGTCALETHSP